MRNLVPVLLMVAVSASAASAAGIMNVRSNLRSQVYLDDQLMGSTPITLSQIPLGDHVLKLIEPGSEDTKRLYFRIPNYVNVQKDVDVEFFPGDPANTVLQADGSDASHQARSSRQYKDSPPPRRRRDNTKVRVRNTALGVGTVGLLMNSGPLKVIGFGGALVNELVNK